MDHKTYRYFVFGLQVKSDLEIPQLISSNEQNHFDVEILLSDVPKQLQREPKKKGVTYELAPTEFVLDLVNIARYYVVDGNKIFITLKKQTDLKDVRLFLLGSCFGALLLQRKSLPLHASGFVHNDEAVLISGLSGMGKSTTTNAFRLKGYKVITDDICPIKIMEEIPYAVSGYPQAKLWEDALEELEIEYKSLPHVRSNLSKRVVRFTDHFETVPKPIKRIYVLGIHDEPEVEIKDIFDSERFMVIKNVTYKNYFIEGLDLYPAHFKNCVELANYVDMKYLYRPRENSLDKVVEAIENDLKGTTK